MYNDPKRHIRGIIRGQIEEHKSNLDQVKACIEQDFQTPLSPSDSAYIERKYIKYCSNFWLTEITGILRELIDNKSRDIIRVVFSSLDNIESLPFGELLERIRNLEGNTCGESRTVLQEAAECLQQEEDLFLKDTFNKAISAYIKPIEIEERRIDNRLVIEVKGKKVVVSQILGQLQNKLSANSAIEEVRFVGADIIYVDANFENRIWHGKNIAISTKTIKICNDVTWNVSGKDNDHIYSNNAGTGEDGHGKPGADGYPGESGGNVLVLAKKIENPENFTIRSNGGKGSKGQDGGNGNNGKDGKGISKAEFDKKFPAVARFLTPRMTGVLTVIDSIIEDYSEINKFWYTGTGTIHDIAGDIRELIERAASAEGDEVAPSYDAIPIDFKENVFIEAMTSEGNEITFSFEYGGWFTSCQAFLLYKGSFGRPGGHRGECGLGGRGGYAGEITVRSLENSSQEFGIMKNTKQGEAGERGQSGKCGSHGKNGLDMGYLDHAWWNKVEFRDQGKYKVEYYDGDNSPSNRVWCPRNKKYAGIIAANIEHRAQNEYEERRSTEQNNCRQPRTEAVRKKNISEHSILTNYSNSFSSIENDTLQNLRSDLDSTRQQALRAITENREQLLERQTIELGVRRCVNFTSQRT